MAIKAIILDWAGTTMDYGCMAPAVVFGAVFKKYGVEISVEEARQPMGAHKKVHIRALTQIPSVNERWRSVHGSAPTEEDVERMFTDFVPMQIACLADYSDLIPGCLEAIADFRARGLKIGSTTGYTPEMMDLLRSEAKARGYEPDATVSAGDVPEGRPAPWMCLENARLLGVWPMSAIVKVDDTVPGIAEGINAGMWGIGLARSGNEIGLPLAEVDALPEAEYAERIEGARSRMRAAAAHYVVDDITGVAACLDDIERRLAAGETP